MNLIINLIKYYKNSDVTNIFMKLNKKLEQNIKQEMMRMHSFVITEHWKSFA